jgi:hypothetical protein
MHSHLQQQRLAGTHNQNIANSVLCLLPVTLLGLFARSKTVPRATYTGLQQQYFL